MEGQWAYTWPEYDIFSCDGVATGGCPANALGQSDHGFCVCEMTDAEYIALYGYISYTTYNTFYYEYVYEVVDLSYTYEETSTVDWQIYETDYYDMWEVDYYQTETASAANTQEWSWTWDESYYWETSVYTETDSWEYWSYDVSW